MIIKYTDILDITYEDQTDNPKTTVTPLFTTIDLCNRFIDTLKTAFKLLGTPINEISEDVQNIVVSEQITTEITTLENKYNNKLEEYVNKKELVKDYKRVKNKTTHH